MDLSMLMLLGSGAWYVWKKHSDAKEAGADDAGKETDPNSDDPSTHPSDVPHDPPAGEPPIGPPNTAPYVRKTYRGRSGTVWSSVVVKVEDVPGPTSVAPKTKMLWVRVWAPGAPKIGGDDPVVATYVVKASSVVADSKTGNWTKAKGYPRWYLGTPAETLKNADTRRLVPLAISDFQLKKFGSMLEYYAAVYNK